MNNSIVILHFIHYSIQFGFKVRVSVLHDTLPHCAIPRLDSIYENYICFIEYNDKEF